MIDKNKLLNSNTILMINRLKDLKINQLINLLKSKNFKVQLNKVLMMILILLLKNKSKIKNKLIWKISIFLELLCQNQIKLTLI